MYDKIIVADNCFINKNIMLREICENKGHE